MRAWCSLDTAGADVSCTDVNVIVFMNNDLIGSLAVITCWTYCNVHAAVIVCHSS